jgi:MYXO-CTERM domain-containing protein
MKPSVPPSVPSSRKRQAKGCGCNTGADPNAALTLILIAGAVLIARRRR